MYPIFLSNFPMCGLFGYRSVGSPSVVVLDCALSGAFLAGGDTLCPTFYYRTAIE